MLNLSPLLFTGRPHALSATLSCDFSVSVQAYFQDFLSKPLSVSPSGRYVLKSCISSSTGVCAPSPWDSWAQLFAFSRLISHKAPSYFSSVGFTRAVSPDAHSVHLSLLMHALFASLQEQPRLCFLCFVSCLPCSCLHFPSTLKGLHYLSLKSIVFISPISSPKTFKFCSISILFAFPFHFFLKPF